MPQYKYELICPYRNRPQPTETFTSLPEANKAAKRIAVELEAPIKVVRLISLFEVKLVTKKKVVQTSFNKQKSENPNALGLGTES